MLASELDNKFPLFLESPEVQFRLYVMNASERQGLPVIPHQLWEGKKRTMALHGPWPPRAAA